MDDPKLFGALATTFPTAQLVQDGFHVLDRFSRVIPSDNTLKGKHMLRYTGYTPWESIGSHHAVGVRLAVFPVVCTV